MATYLITGTSRGLGLEFTTQLAALPSSQVSTIFASSRNESPALKSLISKFPGRVTFIKLDAEDKDSIAAAVLEVSQHLGGGKGLDVLINNIGVMSWSTDGIAKMDNLEWTMKMNVYTVHDVTSAFLPLLQQGNEKKVVNISTTLGSIAQSSKYAHFPVPAYKITKAAMNMLTVQWALEYAGAGFTFLLVSPGWLKTDLGGEMADLSVKLGAKATLDKILGARQEQNGEFLNVLVEGWEKAEGPNQYDGYNIPW